MRHFVRIAILVFSLVSPSVLCAQSATTSLRGLVKDPSGAVVSNASIVLSNSATGETLTTNSGRNGEYQFVQLPPAKYDITAHATGFGNQSKAAELLVNQPATINFAMTLQTESQTVEVNASQQILNVTDASLGASFDNATIQSLPSETRNVPDILSLQPGVFFLPAPASNPSFQDSRSGSVNGGRSDQGNITLDGVDDNDQVNGFAFTGVLRETQDSIEEFRVTTAGANADAGRSSGAQINLITKTGTNKFHGAAYEYYRTSLTASNDFFNKQAQLNQGLPNRAPKIIRNIFGVDLGGPIVKDKLFFFANFEGLRRAENAQVTETVPTALYRSGILQYATATGIQSVTAAQIAQLDATCTVCGKPGYAPGPGANPNAVAYFKALPVANGTSTGDGLNTGSYTFSSPNPVTQNTTIARFDYLPGSKHRLFVRGNLQKDTAGDVEQFPGQGPSAIRIDNSKGITFGDTWTISSTIVNDIRYGYIRQGYGNTGVGQGDYVDFRFLSTATAESRNTIISNPVNNIVDNFNWTKGKHSIQVGGNWRLVHQNRSSDSNSYNSATSNPSWLGGSPPDPTTIGLPAVSDGFSTSYGNAYSNLVGNIPQVTNNYNYTVSGAAAGTLLADGAPIARHFKANEFEYYLQDSWRARPNLTLTFGIRHTILETPYETSGQQVTPTIDTHAWFTQRETAALKGQIYEPDLTFAPSGKYYGKPGFYPKSKNNIAPRFAVAYAPDSKTSIRLGAGIYYDHFGEGLVNTFDQNGSAGLSSQVSNPAGQTNYENSPRFTGRHTLPFSNGAADPKLAFPFTPQLGNFAITWGIDNRIKTPYSEAFDLSVQRQLPGGFTFEAAYVGRLGRHLLQSLDLTEPVDLVDATGGGMDYYTAGAQLSQAADTNGGKSSATVAKIPYFEHLFPFMAGYDFPGESATQAIYTNEWAPYRVGLGATTAISDIDIFCAGNGYPCPANYKTQFWQDQFSSLYALSTIGISSYHAAQLSLRHPMSHGLQADINYTFSHSIDMGSDAERTSEFSNGVANAASEIINTWHPKLNRGSSDFNTKHLLSADYVYLLPFGKGRQFLASVNPIVNGFIGGWQLSGIVRATSGLPFSIREPGWTTDWQITGYGIATGPVKVRKHLDSKGNVQFFDNVTALNSGVRSGGPVRIPYPGEVGQRNNYLGDGYLDLDSGLSKTWKLGDIGALKFGWETYNVTNTNRFDPQSIGATLTRGALGKASSLLTVPRRMQFSLRYDF